MVELVTALGVFELLLTGVEGNGEFCGLLAFFSARSRSKRSEYRLVFELPQAAVCCLLLCEAPRPRFTLDCGGDLAEYGASLCLDESCMLDSLSG